MVTQEVFFDIVRREKASPARRRLRLDAEWASPAPCLGIALALSGALWVGLGMAVLAAF